MKDLFNSLSNIIQENDEVMKNIVDDLIFDKDTHQINNLPEFTSIKQNTHQIQIDIGYTGKKIVNGIGYIYLSPKRNNDKNIVAWECTAYGSGIREDYLPNNCVIKKL
ncbi:MULTISPECIES: hypothetical protein [unclassified Francisella]|uniref:hypothetical protein n=1 Tax=unclassified Francisella TaxID=2610885 RepID=UPI002E311C0C|nr:MULTISPECIES: hypothetical protein [unclassified Francisella]MED7819820.1 hypothetical protein [Francisella sp. 19S2-4]MED7830665.1 hypothetical protein [Francisella sp. 19S2-10]